MTWVLILGVIMNLVALPLAAKRAGFLAGLITGGQPAPDRIGGVTGASVRRSRPRWSRSSARRSC